MSYCINLSDWITKQKTIGDVEILVAEMEKR